MKNLLQNHFSCIIMIWEVNPSKRNKNNQVNILVNIDQYLAIGDVITELFSNIFYEVLSIESRKPSALKKKDYLVLSTKYSSKPPVFSRYKLITNSCFN